MTRRLNSLKWLSILGPVILTALFSYAVYFYLPSLLPPAALLLLIVLVTGFAALVLSRFLFDLFEAREQDMLRRHRELVALRQAGEAIRGPFELTDMLARALDAILEFTHAGAGRVWLVDEDSGELKNVVHRGLFPDAFAGPATLGPGEGTPGRVALTAKPEGIPDLSAAGPEFAALCAKGFIEFACVPLSARERVVGVIDVASRHSGELASTSLEFLTSIGREVGLAIENAQLFDVARTRQRRAEDLYRTGIALSSKLDLSQVLNTVTERGRTLLNMDASALCLWDEQKRWLVVSSQSGPSEAFEGPAADAGASGGKIVGRRVAQRIDLVRADRTHKEEDCVSCALIRGPFRQTHVELPVRAGDQVIGCLCVSSAQARGLSDHEVEVLGGLADQAAVAIQNARAFDRAGNVAVTMERERLAREMHDTLAQVLGFVNTKSQALRELLDRGQIDTARAQIDQLTVLSQELYADVREVILGLRTAISPDRGLLPALDSYIQVYSTQSGIDTRLVIEDGAGEIRFAPAVELQLIRIVQESLTNVRKHARAQHAIVRFSKVDGHAEMRVEDDGSGFDPAHIARRDWPQFGLQTMRERAESVGGAFVVVSQPGVGAQIIVQIPLCYSGGQ